jgi:hypothetical protein
VLAGTRNTVAWAALGHATAAYECAVPTASSGVIAQQLAHQAPMWGYLGQLYAIGGWTSLPWLGSLRQPTLVLAGDDDPIVPLVNGRILARRIPNARLHVVRGGGHLFLLKRPARIAALVAGFLELAAEGGHLGRATPGPGPTRDTRQPRRGWGPCGASTSRISPASDHRARIPDAVAHPGPARRSPSGPRRGPGNQLRVGQGRFPAPVPVGSRVRLTAIVEKVEPVPSGFQLSLASTVECDAAPKPACAAQVLCRFVGPRRPGGCGSRVRTSTARWPLSSAPTTILWVLRPAAEPARWRRRQTGAGTRLPGGGGRDRPPLVAPLEALKRL